MSESNSYNYLNDYLSEIQSRGRYAVSLEELKERFNISEKGILQNIYRLKNKKVLAQVRKGFYVIIPPQYMKTGMLPPALFIDDMMRHLNREYYVALFSAAALHGAGHQQPMEFLVITKKPPLRDIENTNLVIRFFTKGKWQSRHIVKIKTDSGYLAVSSPALTAFDLVAYHKQVGGINRILPILEELVESIKPAELSTAALDKKSPVIQRLGYLLDELERTDLSHSLNSYLKNQRTPNTPLSLAHKRRTGPINEKWGVIINTEIDL